MGLEISRKSRLFEKIFDFNGSKKFLRIETRCCRYLKVSPNIACYVGIKIIAVFLGLKVQWHPSNLTKSVAVQEKLVNESRST